MSEFPHSVSSIFTTLLDPGGPSADLGQHRPARHTVSTLHANLSIPVTAKFRIFPSLERTIAYAQMMEQAGASILTCHGRTREMKGHNTVSSCLTTR
jgi:tRNA-dihydrouridine synthase